MQRVRSRSCASPRPASHGRARRLAATSQIEQFVMTRRGVLALRADQILVADRPERDRARASRAAAGRTDRLGARAGRPHGRVAATHRARARRSTSTRSLGCRESRARDRSVACRALARRHAPRGGRAHGAHRGCADGASRSQPRDGAQAASTCVIQTEPGEGGVLHFLPNARDPARLRRSTTIACFRLHTVTWWSTDGEARPRHDSIAPASELAAVADGLVVTADRESLALTTPTGQQFLGYAFARREPDLPVAGAASRSRRRYQPPLVLDARPPRETPARDSERSPGAR